MQQLIDKLDELIHEMADERSRQQLIDHLDASIRARSIRTRSPKSAYSNLRTAERHLATVKRLLQMVQAQRRAGICR